MSRFDDFIRGVSQNPGALVEQVAVSAIPFAGAVFTAADYLGNVLDRAFGKKPARILPTTSMDLSVDQLWALAERGLRVQQVTKIQGGPTLTSFEYGLEPLQRPGWQEVDIYANAVRPEDYDMAFNLSALPSIFQGVGQAFGGTNSAVSSIFNLGSAITSAFVPQATSNLPAVMQAPVAMPVAASAGQVMKSLPAAGAMVSRGFFARFPALATAIQSWRSRGIPMTRAKLWAVVKRFGPEATVAAGLLSAGAVTELLVAGSGRRRMNPANAKALRRSIRRVQSFHKLCQSADVISRGRRRKCK